MLTSKFEDIKMLEEETFDEFYSKFMEIVNSLISLGERMDESKTVRKILRSLPKRFKPKIVAIAESKDVDKIKIEELRRNLLTYELDLEVPSKKKGVAFSSQLKENESDVESDDDNVLFVKKFKKFFSNNKNSRNSEENKSPKFQRNQKGSFTKKDVQCYNCKGFGHIAQNCSTLKESEKGDRKGKKVLNITWDEEDEGSDNNESQNDEDENISKWLLFTSIEESN